MSDADHEPMTGGPMTAEQKEARRLRAAALFAEGVCPAEAARRLGVSRQTASEWRARWEAGGGEALRARPTGPPPRLSGPQRAELASLLVAGPRAAGRGRDLWTLAEVAALAEERFGVRHHPGHVWHVLRAMGFTCQKPERAARERDAEAVEAFLADGWPAAKRGRGQRAGGSPSGTGAASR